MKPKKVMTEAQSLETYLEIFTHCWLKFHSTGDDYAGKLKEIKYEGHNLTLIFSRMSKCMEFEIDRLGTKKWYPTKHFLNYHIPDIDANELRAQFAKMNLEANGISLTFILENKDEITFTRDPKVHAEIDEILNKTL